MIIGGGGLLRMRHSAAQMSLAGAHAIRDVAMPVPITLPCVPVTLPVISVNPVVPPVIVPPVLIVIPTVMVMAFIVIILAGIA